MNEIYEWRFKVQSNFNQSFNATHNGLTLTSLESRHTRPANVPRPCTSRHIGVHTACTQSISWVLPGLA